MAHCFPHQNHLVHLVCYGTDVVHWLCQMELTGLQAMCVHEIGSSV